MPALTMDTPHEPQIRSQIITDSHVLLVKSRECSSWCCGLALIPKRGHSQKFPSKNCKLLNVVSSFSLTTLSSLQFFEGNFCECPLFGIKARPQHQELHSLLLTRSTLVLKLSLQTSAEEIHKTQDRERMQDFCSFGEKHIN